jgi:hypothetical protein
MNENKSFNEFKVWKAVTRSLNFRKSVPKVSKNFTMLMRSCRGEKTSTITLPRLVHGKVILDVKLARNGHFTTIPIELKYNR